MLKIRNGPRAHAYTKCAYQQAASEHTAPQRCTPSPAGCHARSYRWAPVGGLSHCALRRPAAALWPRPQPRILRAQLRNLRLQPLHRARERFRRLVREEVGHTTDSAVDGAADGEISGLLDALR